MGPFRRRRKTVHSQFSGAKGTMPGLVWLACVPPPALVAIVVHCRPVLQHTPALSRCSTGQTYTHPTSPTATGIMHSCVASPGRSWARRHPTLAYLGSRVKGTVTHPSGRCCGPPFLTDGASVGVPLTIVLLICLNARAQTLFSCGRKGERAEHMLSLPSCCTTTPCQCWEGVLKRRPLPTTSFNFGCFSTRGL